MTVQWVGTGGQEPGRKRAGGGRREGGKRESRGGGNREKLRKSRNILLYFAIEMGQRGGSHYGEGRDAGVQVTGRGSRRHGKREFQTPLSLPTVHVVLDNFVKRKGQKSM